MESRNYIDRVPTTLLSYKKDFDIDVSRWLLELSVVSYIDNLKELEDQISKNTNFKIKKVCEKDYIEALVLYSDDVIVVSFAGTELNEFNDINTDLKFWHSYAEDVGIHHGFYTAYKKIKFDVYKAVLELQKEKHREVYWTGHSLGGALAVVFATFWKYESVVYTFAQPKVGDRDFATLTSKRARHYRITSNADLAPKFPVWFRSYCHSGDELRFIVGPEMFSLEWIRNYFGRQVATFILATLFRLSWALLNFAWFFKRAWSNHSALTYRKLLWDDKAEHKTVSSHLLSDEFISQEARTAWVR